MKKCFLVLLVIAYCVASFVITYNVIDFQSVGSHGDNDRIRVSLKDVQPFLKTRLRINLYINKEENSTEKITQDIEIDPKLQNTNYNIFLKVDEGKDDDHPAGTASKNVKVKVQGNPRLLGTQGKSISPPPSADFSKPSLSFLTIIKGKHTHAPTPTPPVLTGTNPTANENERRLEAGLSKIAFMEGATSVEPCFVGNVDFKGADLQIRRTTSALACQLVCREREQRCKSFTWISQEHPDPHLHGICYMKISEGDIQQAQGAISGPEACTSAEDGQS